MDLYSYLREHGADYCTRPLTEDDEREVASDEGQDGEGTDVDGTRLYGL